MPDPIGTRSRRGHGVLGARACAGGSLPLLEIVIWADKYGHYLANGREGKISGSRQGIC